MVEKASDQSSELESPSVRVMPSARNQKAPDDAIGEHGSDDTKRTKVLVRIVSAFSFALGVWIVCLNLYLEGQNVKIEAYAVFVALFVAILAYVFVSRTWLSSILQSLKRVVSRRSVVVVIVMLAITLGFAARLVFLAFDYAPDSDPSGYFTRAQAFWGVGSQADNMYTALFPHVFGYDAFLAILPFGVSQLSVILSNSILDLVAAFLLGYFAYRITGSRKWQLAASVVWWLSPFNIIFTAISLPVIAVNMLFILLLVLLACQNSALGKTKVFLFYSLPIGLVVFCGNTMRPFAIVLIISIAIFFAFICIKQRNPKILRDCVLSLAAIVIVVYGLNAGINQLISNKTGYPTNTHAATWSIYVGLNYETEGRFNSPDYQYMLRIVEENGINEGLEILQGEAVDRVTAMGPFGFAKHLVAKSARLTGDVQNNVYNLNASYAAFDPSIHPIRLNCVHIICAFYWFAILSFAVRYLWDRRTNSKLDIMVFVQGFVVLLFFASLFVEVANRYFMPFFPMFTIFAILGMQSCVSSLLKTKQGRSLT